MTFVLVVDDDAAIRRSLAINLNGRDYDVETAGDGRSALQIVHERMPDVVLLDLGLPDMGGIEVLRQLRSFTQVPIIVVSARTEADDKVEALDLGANDYVTKPFSMQELLARIRVATRTQVVDDAQHTVTVGELTLDLGDSRATKSGQEVHLTPIEWKIVESLVPAAADWSARSSCCGRCGARAMRARPTICGCTWPASDASWSRTRHCRNCSSPNPASDTASPAEPRSACPDRAHPTAG